MPSSWVTAVAVDGDNEVGLLVREQVLDDVDGAHVGGAQLAHQEGGPGRLGDEVELLGLGINITQQNIIRNNILHKGGLVVLFLIIGLGPVEGHHRHGTQGSGQLVLTLDESGIVKLGAPAGQGLEDLALEVSLGIVRRVNGGHRTGPVLPDTGELAAGHHNPVGIDHAHHAVDAVLHLEDDTLEHPA